MHNKYHSTISTYQHVDDPNSLGVADGASELARLGYGMLDIMLYGRWLSDKAAREYVRRGETELLKLEMETNARLRDRLTKWSSLSLKLVPHGKEVRLRVQDLDEKAMKTLERCCI